MKIYVATAIGRGSSEPWPADTSVDERAHSLVRT